jgi:hypothetical protein
LLLLLSPLLSVSVGTPLPGCSWSSPGDRLDCGGDGPYPGQARCLALGFWPECFRRLNVKGGQRPFPKETRSALDIEGKHVTIQGPSPDLTSSVSGLLRDLAHVRQGRRRCLWCCPGLTVMTLGRPPHRAREGHGLLIGDISGPGSSGCRSPGSALHPRSSPD